MNFVFPSFFKIRAVALILGFLFLFFFIGLVRWCVADTLKVPVDCIQLYSVTLGTDHLSVICIDNQGNRIFYPSNFLPGYESPPSFLLIPDSNLTNTVVWFK
jgi:hypothetical protein